MKTSHIFIIIVLAVAVGIIISTANSTSQYVDFDQAIALSSNGSNAKIHVVGQLKRNEAGELVDFEYDPTKDANLMQFVLIDEAGKEQNVISGPVSSLQDFKRSEKIVVEGKMDGNEFVATKILLKCPSKYEETEVKS